MERRAALRRRELRNRRADAADALSTAPKGVLVDDDYAMKASDMPVPASIQQVARELAKRNARKRELARRRGLRDRD